MLIFALFPAANAQVLPPAAPTQGAATGNSGAAQVPRAIPQETITPAKVVFADNLLTVTAQNSSLNQILGDISRATGMKITGGVNEERVFGSYGPASPQDVLVSLLDGTGSNILLHEDSSHRVRELVLTARLGGVTPPSPPGANTGNEVPSDPVQPSDRWKRLQERRGAARQRMQEEMNAPQPQPDQNGTPPQQAQPSPNGVRTPNQFGRQGAFGPPTLPPETPPN